MWSQAQNRGHPQKTTDRRQENDEQRRPVKRRFPVWPETLETLGRARPADVQRLRRREGDTTNTGTQVWVFASHLQKTNVHYVESCAQRAFLGEEERERPLS